MSGPFQSSFALLDKNGCLIDWDSGFVEEFSASEVAPNRGTLFRDIAYSAHAADGIRRAEMNRAPHREGNQSEFTYVDALSRNIQVCESQTSEGKILRLAKYAGAVISPPDEINGRVNDSLTVPIEMQRRADGRALIVASEQLQKLFKLPNVDTSKFLSALLSKAESTSEARAKVSVAFEESARNLSPLTYEMQFREEDDGVKWYRVSATPAPQPDGAIIWRGICRDITREKLTGDQIELFRSVVVQSSDAVVIVDVTSHGGQSVLYANPAAEQMFGLSMQDWIGQRLSLFVHKDDQRQLSPKLLTTLQRGDGKRVEYEAQRSDGSAFWVDARAAIAQRYVDGAYHWVVMFRDISERRRVQEELLQASEEAETARAEAERATRVKSEFLANMSHEIRTPMNGILGMTSLLLDTPLNDEQRGYAEAVRESGEILLTVINDILDISKLEEGKVKLEAIDFALTDTVEGAVMLLAPRAHEKGIDVGVFIDPKLRGAYRGDPNRLRQILFNLVGNGIKFTERGSVSLEVSLARGDDTSEQTYLRFEVKDTGIGMPEEVRVRLFEKFSQADASITRRYGGTGLGLAISKQLVELMGGTIGVESRPGLGSTFYFEIPLATALAVLPDRQTVALHLKGVRALAVDDIDMNLEIISRQLRGLGMEIFTCKDAFDGLAELERSWHKGTPYDIVFLDQMMPGLSGEGLASRIRANPNLACTKLVMITSAGVRDRGDGLKLLDRVIEKPLRQRDLLSSLATLFEATAPVSSSDPTPVPAIMPSSPVERRSLNILLAEDNKINQKFVTAILRKAHHDVDLAENGLQAVDSVRRTDYDVILMDVQMPELDGLQATRQIRVMPPPKGDVYIIALTAHAMAGAREACHAAGMNDYLSKPIDGPLLLSKLQDAMHKTLEDGENPAQAAPPLAPSINVAQLESIRHVMEQDEFCEQLSALRDEFVNSVARIKVLLQAHNLSESAREAHNLVSVAGNYGAQRLSSLARLLEQACVRADQQTATRLNQELHPAAQEAADEFDRILIHTRARVG